LPIGNSSPADIAEFRAFRKSEQWFFDWNQIGKKTRTRRMPMNKNDLVAAVAEQAELSKQQAGAAVDAVFDSIETAMAKGDDVRLVGFGTFSVSHRAASKGRNPSTGAEVDIPARNVPKFAPGKGLKDAVNK
jgi:DNA-binding protein HU-beta